jgi:hypothetical protein
MKAETIETYVSVQGMASSNPFIFSIARRSIDTGPIARRLQLNDFGGSEIFDTL